MEVNSEEEDPLFIGYYNSEEDKLFFYEDIRLSEITHALEKKSIGLVSVQYIEDEVRLEWVELPKN